MLEENFDLPWMVSFCCLHNLFDFGCFVADDGMGFGYTVELGHGGARAVLLSAVPIVTGGFGEEEDAAAEYDSPEESNTHWDSIGASVRHSFSAEVNAVCCEDSEGDD